MSSKKVRKPGIIHVISELFLIVLLTALLMIPLILENLVRTRLQQAEGGTVESVSVRPLNREISFNNLQLDNFAVSRELLVTGTIKKLEITGIPVIALLMKGEIIIKGVTLWAPNLDIVGKKAEKAAADTLPVVNLSEISTLKIYDGNFKIKDAGNGRYTLQQFSFEVSPLSLVKDNFQGGTEYSFTSGAVTYLTPDSLYNISIHELKGVSENKIIVLDSVRVTPSYSENDFKNHIEFQSDRFDFNCPRIIITLPDHVAENVPGFHAAQLLFESLQLRAFRDKRLNRDPEQKFESLQNYLEKIDFDFLIDTFVIDKGDIRYRERIPESDESGEIQFSEATIKGYGLKSGRDSTRALTITMNCRFMNSGSLDAKLDFPYGKDHFLCEGVLKGMPMTELNSITGPNAGLLFNEGQVQALHFNFRADNNYAKGDLNIQYRNMNFTVKNKIDGDTLNFSSRLKTLAAGIFIKKEGRKDDSNISLQGTICQERRTDRFVFNYIWKSILSGLKSALVGTFGTELQNKGSKSPC